MYYARNKAYGSGHKTDKYQLKIYLKLAKFLEASYPNTLSYVAISLPCDKIGGKQFAAEISHS